MQCVLWPEWSWCLVVHRWDEDCILVGGWLSCRFWVRWLGIGGLKVDDGFCNGDGLGSIGRGQFVQV